MPDVSYCDPRAFLFGFWVAPIRPVFIHFQKSGGGDETGIMTDGGQTDRRREKKEISRETNVGG